MAYTDAVMIGVFGAGDTSELYIDTAAKIHG